MRKPVVITSLEEDLQIIGLLPRKDPKVEAREVLGESSYPDAMGKSLSRDDEVVKGFANVAVIAGTLSERFGGFCRELGEEALCQVSAVLEDLADEASTQALSLQEQGPTDDEEINQLFKMFMAKLLDALQLYNDITAGPDAGDVGGVDWDED